jgi:hypothetical protein
VPSARASLAALALAAALLPACGGASAQPGGYAVTVRSGGKTAGRFDVAALRAMPAVDVATPQSRGKQIQHGPLVRTILARAGIQRFGRLRAAGPGSAQTFTAAEVDDQVVLDFDNRGTVKLAGAHLAQDRWVQDVTELDADP